MRVLFTTTGYSGHVIGLLPFARACARAGHELVVAGPAERAANVERHFLPFRGVAGPPPGAVEAILHAVGHLPAESADRRVLARGVVDAVARAALPGMLELVEAWEPDIVVRESHEFAGYLAAELHGIPHARVGLGLGTTEQVTMASAAGPVDVLRRELGLRPDPAGAELRAAPYLTLAPAALEDPAAAPARLTHRFRETTPPARIERRGRPLVYLTFGTLAATLGFFPAAFRAAIDALAGLPVDLHVSTARLDPTELGPLPANVRAETWAREAEVVPRASAVVCHGGYGSTLRALAAGVPLVVLPTFAGDQWRNARLIDAAGVGIALLGPPRAMLDGPGAEVIAELPRAVEAVLEDPRYRRVAGRIAADMRALPSVDAAAAVLAAAAAPRPMLAAAG